MKELFGSTVVAVRTDNELVIGADSRIVDAARTKVDDACKIIQVGNVFFAHTGLAGNRSIGFDVQETAAEAIANGNSHEERIQIFAQLVGNPLHRILVATKQQAPEFYAQVVQGQSAMSVVLCSVENRTPILSYVEFKPVDHPQSDNGLAVMIEHEVDVRSQTEDPAFVVIGHKDAIVRTLQAEPHIWRRGIVSVVRSLIDAEIENTPDFVGPPVAL